MSNGQQQPQNVVQATGQVASEVVSGLKTQPMLLALIVLNVLGLFAAGYVAQSFVAADARDDEEDRMLIRELIDSNRNTAKVLLEACFPDRRFPDLPPLRERHGKADEPPNTTIVKKTTQ